MKCCGWVNDMKPDKNSVRPLVGGRCVLQALTWTSATSSSAGAVAARRVAASVCTRLPDMAAECSDGQPSSGATTCDAHANRARRIQETLRPPCSAIVMHGPDWQLVAFCHHDDIDFCHLTFHIRAAVPQHSNAAARQYICFTSL